jgi:hypothetical protein
MSKTALLRIWLFGTLKKIEDVVCNFMKNLSQNEVIGICSEERS